MATGCANGESWSHSWLGQQIFLQSVPTGSAARPLFCPVDCAALSPRVKPSERKADDSLPPTTTLKNALHSTVSWRGVNYTLGKPAREMYEEDPTLCRSITKLARLHWSERTKRHKRLLSNQSRDTRRLLGCSRISRNSAGEGTASVSEPPTSRAPSPLHGGKSVVIPKPRLQVGALVRWYVRWAICTKRTRFWRRTTKS